VNEDLKPTGHRFPDVRHGKIIGCLQHSRIPLYPGFSCIFARTLLEQVRWDPNDPGSQQTHDAWICFLANSLGRTYYTSESLALYRRHHNTVTGEYGPRPLFAMFNDARSASSADYRKHSQITFEYADLLERRSQETRSWTIALDLQRAGAHYARFASCLQSRAFLYEAKGFFARIKIFLTLLMRGAYVGRPGIVLGPRALVKDIIITLLGPSRVTLRR
jgi:hypothetical protein